MDAEFHYHVNAIVSRLAGFSAQESCIIASSSQFVDDNCKSIAVQLEDRIYRNIITQTLNLNLPDKELDDIYTTFHFQPQGGYENFWVTKPNTPIARSIFARALATNNLYMIGIASHVFADTYAHQDFIGHNHPYNTPISNIPSYGHIYYLELPDLVAVKWIDIRTNKTINNNLRFLDAACDLLEFYTRLLKNSEKEIKEKKSKLISILKPIFGRAKIYIPDFKLSMKERIKQYKKAYQELGGDAMPEYGPQKWQRRAIYYSGIEKSWRATHNFENSHWHNFQEQAKRYKSLAMSVINENIAKYKRIT
ncbi:MAG: hypothetical protein K0R73_1428 [Candidatus Midichloriaceae bacterium]|jgi:hypothetical protein|nr:hypothetical protein [Candidatus Midichloriaceae bacterium]